MTVLVSSIWNNELKKNDFIRHSFYFTWKVYISKKPTYVIYKVLIKQANFTSGEISQIPQVSLFFHILYPRDLRNWKRSRHKSFTDDKHFTEVVFNGFHFVNRHFRLWLEWLKQIKFLVKLIVFFMTVLASPKKITYIR